MHLLTYLLTYLLYIVVVADASITVTTTSNHDLTPLFVLLDYVVVPARSPMRISGWLRPLHATE